MLIELAIVILVILLLITVYLALVYFGLFEEIQVKVGRPPVSFGGRFIAYKKERGKYSDVGGLFTEVCSLVPRLNSIGIYYDDPSKQDVCRYTVGAILSREEEQRQVEADLLKSKGFSFGQLPDVDNVVYSVFPFRGTISVVIAIRRVYPVIKTYIKEHNLCAHPALEIYDGTNMFFIWPLAKQDHFKQFHDPEKSSDNSDEDEESNEESEQRFAKPSSSGKPFLAKQGSKRSSTSSSFEELQAEDNGY